MCAHVLSVYKYTAQWATVVCMESIYNTIYFCIAQFVFVFWHVHIYVFPCTSGIPRHEAIKFDFVPETWPVVRSQAILCLCCVSHMFYKRLLLFHTKVLLSDLLYTQTCCGPLLPISLSCLSCPICQWKLWMFHCPQSNVDFVNCFRFSTAKQKSMLVLVLFKIHFKSLWTFWIVKYMMQFVLWQSYCTYIDLISVLSSFLWLGPELCVPRHLLIQWLGVYVWTAGPTVYCSSQFHSCNCHHLWKTCWSLGLSIVTIYDEI